MYYGNCLAILNEHVKLQPNTQKSMPFIARRCVRDPGLRDLLDHSVLAAPYCEAQVRAIEAGRVPPGRL